MPGLGPVVRRAVVGALTKPLTRPLTGPLSRPFTGSLARRAGIRDGAGNGDTGSPNILPDIELRVRDVGVDREHLARYARVCGFRLSNTLPATYPHILGFPLQMAMLGQPDFPIRLLGLVHIRNVIEQVRPLCLDDRLCLTVRADNLHDHKRGRAVDLVLEATVDDAVVWRERSTYLHRSKSATRPTENASGQAAAAPDERAIAHETGQAAGHAEQTEPPRATAYWKVPADTGRAYARVSGDHNPIHTSTLGARLFGFPRRIAHGMWSKARCLAALEGRLPDAFTVDVSFKLPILLPATVGFAAAPDEGGWRFSLHDAATGKPYLAGTVSPTGR